MNKLNTSFFFCVGAQKSGTTSLHDILRHHPEIYLPKAKEAHFFDKDERYTKGLDWWYSEFFKNHRNEKCTGTMTPEYLYYEEVPERIVEHLGTDLKIIIVLRNPIDRAYSHYLMSKRRGYEELTFAEAIEAEPERIKLGEFERDNYSYIDRGRYSVQIERYTSLFKPDQLLFLSFENDIKQNIDQTIVRIQEFLGAKVVPLNTAIKSNVASETSSKKVQQFINESNPVKRQLKKIIPSQTRRVIKQKMSNWNSRKITSNNSLSEEERTHYYQKHFKQEPELLKSLTGMDFSYWQD
ncbi:MAG: sulfotransferase domain-containing protein [Crocinitomicaceae bacterium]|nr:sulfotransferase domain-containing protein [Crocinitomicaceae bacterium]